VEREKIVISLGGSTLFMPSGAVDSAFIKHFCHLIIDVAREKSVAIVVGGGKRAGAAADAERKKGRGEFFADREAIKVTKKNAETLRKCLGKFAGAKIANGFDEVAEQVKRGKIAVAGGMLEGITTDTVAVLAAERIGAERVVNVSLVDGIYTDNPVINPHAQRFGLISHEKLVDLANRHDQRMARTNFVFDSIAAKLAARSEIEIDFADKHDLDNLRACLDGRKFDGTIVKN